MVGRLWRDYGRDEDSFETVTVLGWRPRWGAFQRAHSWWSEAGRSRPR